MDSKDVSRKGYRGAWRQEMDEQQLAILESAYIVSETPSFGVAVELARMTRLTAKQVLVWFNDKRFRENIATDGAIREETPAMQQGSSENVDEIVHENQYVCGSDVVTPVNRQEECPEPDWLTSLFRQYDDMIARNEGAGQANPDRRQGDVTQEASEVGDESDSPPE